MSEQFEPTATSHQQSLGETIVEFTELNNLVAIVSGALGLAIYGIVVWQTGWKPTHGSYLIVGAMLSAVGACGIMTFVPHVQDRFRFCTNGVEVLRRDESVIVTLDELAGFTISKTHAYQNGVYTGSTAKVRIESNYEPLVKFSLNFRKDTIKEEALEAFSDLATHTVAMRMLEQIKSEGRSHWTGRVTITSSGLEVEDRSGQVEEVPFAAICEYKTSNGVFELRRAGRRIMKSNVDASNFLPGLRLVQWLSDHVKAGQTVSDLSDAPLEHSPAEEPEQQEPVIDGYALLASEGL